MYALSEKTETIQFTKEKQHIKKANFLSIDYLLDTLCSQILLSV